MGNELARLATALLDRLDTYEESCFYREERGALRAHLAAAGAGGSGVEGHEARMREGLNMFTLAAVTLERDVLLHDLTEDEQRVIVGAVLNAADRTLPSTQDEADVERVAEMAARAALRMVAKVLRDSARETREDSDPRAGAVSDGLTGVAEAIEEDLEKLVRDIATAEGLKLALANVAMPLTRPDGEEVAKLVERLRTLLTKATTPNTFDWYFPWRVRPDGGKPTIVGARSGNLFRGFIGTWDEADLIVETVNALPVILAALIKPAALPKEDPAVVLDAVGRELNADGASAEQVERASAAVQANLTEDGLPKYDSAFGYACALTAVMQADAAALPKEGEKDTRTWHERTGRAS